MLKSTKKNTLLVATLGLFALSGTSHAVSNSIVGTQIVGSINGGGSSMTSGLAGGIFNLYYQGRLSRSSAIIAQFQSDPNFSVYGAAYKSYIGNKRYTNAPYWKLGASIYDQGSLNNATTADIGVGYDFMIGRNLIFGIDGTFSTSLNSGGSVTYFGFNIGYGF
ncbi:MAG: hypothetical protein ACWGOV_00570 [Acidiferrobacterales bacterium]